MRNFFTQVCIGAAISLSAWDTDEILIQIENFHFIFDDMEKGSEGCWLMGCKESGCERLVGYVPTVSVLECSKCSLLECSK